MNKEEAEEEEEEEKAQEEKVQEKEEEITWASADTLWRRFFFQTERKRKHYTPTQP